MRMKITKTMRPELRRLTKDMKTGDAIAKMLGVKRDHWYVMKCRGWLSIDAALRAEKNSNGKYRARLLCQRGDL